MKRNRYDFSDNIDISFDNLSLKKRNRENNLEYIDDVTIINYLNNYPFLYKSIQAAALLSISDVEKNNINKSPNSILRIIYNNILENLNNHFNDKFTLEVSSNIEDNNDENITKFLTCLYKITMNYDLFKETFGIYSEEIKRYITKNSKYLNTLIPYKIWFTVYFANEETNNGECMICIRMSRMNEEKCNRLLELKRKNKSFIR